MIEDTTQFNSLQNSLQNADDPNGRFHRVSRRAAFQELGVTCFLFIFQLAGAVVRYTFDETDRVWQAVSIINLAAIMISCFICSTSVKWSSILALGVPYMILLWVDYVNAWFLNPWYFLQCGVDFTFYMGLYFAWAKYEQRREYLEEGKSKAALLCCLSVHIALLLISIANVDKDRYRGDFRSLLEQLLLLGFLNLAIPPRRPSESEGEQTSTLQLVAGVELLVFYMVWMPVWIFWGDSIVLLVSLGLLICIAIGFSCYHYHALIPNSLYMDLATMTLWFILVIVAVVKVPSLPLVVTALASCLNFALWCVGPSRRLTILCAVGHGFFVIALMIFPTVQADPYSIMAGRFVAFQVAAKIAFGYLWQPVDAPREQSPSWGTSNITQEVVAERILVILYLTCAISSSIIGLRTNWRTMETDILSQAVAIVQIIFNVIASGVAIATLVKRSLERRLQLPKTILPQFALWAVMVFIFFSRQSMMLFNYGIISMYFAVGVCWLTVSKSYLLVMFHCLFIAFATTLVGTDPCVFLVVHVIFGVMCFNLFQDNTLDLERYDASAARLCGKLLIARYIIWCVSFILMWYLPYRVCTYFQIGVDSLTLLVGAYLSISRPNYFKRFEFSWRDTTIIVPLSFLVIVDGFFVRYNLFSLALAECMMFFVIYILLSAHPCVWVPSEVTGGYSQLICGGLAIVLYLAFAASVIFMFDCGYSWESLRTIAQSVLLCQLLLLKMLPRKLIRPQSDAIFDQSGRPEIAPPLVTIPPQ